MEVENANCRLRISQCSDFEFSPIQRPLKVDCTINGLDHLLSVLHKIFSRDHVNVQDVQNVMSAYKSEPRHWRKYAKYDRFRYTRNLVDAGNGLFNVMILCWGPGHASAIHDHADSHCFMKMLGGNLEEVRYDWPENVQPEVLKKLNLTKVKSTNQEPISDSQSDCSSCHPDKEISCTCGKNGGKCMVETGRTRLEINDVCYINDALGLHRVENPSHIDGAVSLHLYCPPFDSCRVFDARTGKPSDVKVTFTSIDGKRVRKAMENCIADSQ